MARLGRFGFVLIAVLFHCIYIVSIFDVYFVSPIVHGMRAFAVERGAGERAPARRLVLFVGDGLRADKAFQSFPDPSPTRPGSAAARQPRPLMPFLRSRVEEHGTFGVSHTRVPTESRPGHVALIAGLYEDVSSVMTGWKLNPVNFDSVFNRSRHTWSWGSPDILPMFKEGAVPGRIDADCYPEDFEDFSSDAVMLDYWVFDKVERMFAAAAKDAALDAELRQDKNVFFLHLLGLDTTGHSYRPFSREYLHNIKVVDEGVKNMTSLMDDFFGDGETAYVFTADHGMSDWGSHGDGHPDNTRTPFVVWGAGVNRPAPVQDAVAPGHDDWSSDWGLSHIPRHDIEQADIATLMAYLAGLEYPVNSVGRLPLPYVAGDAAEKAKASLVNAREVLEMYDVKEAQKRAVELNYQPYGAFSGSSHTTEARVAAIQDLIARERYEQAIEDSHELLRVGIEGLRYLQTYDWLFLRVLITLGYLGWIAFAITIVVDLHVLHGRTETSHDLPALAAFGAVLVALLAMLVVKRSPYTYYLYAPFPVLFWLEVFARREAVVSGGRLLFAHVRTAADGVRVAAGFVASVALLEGLVASYFYREIYTVSYLAAISWPFFYGADFVKQNVVLIASWAAACASMSAFTLLSAIKTEDANIVTFGGLLMFAVGVLYLVFESRLLAASPESAQSTPQNTISRTLLGAQTGLIVLAVLVTRGSIASLQAKQGLPLGNQILGWITLIASLVLPFLHSLQPNTHYLHRLVVVFLTFSPTFIILTISYEGLFYFAFCMTLVTWVRLEHHIHIFTASQQTIAKPPSPPLQPNSPSAALNSIAHQLSSADEGDSARPGPAQPSYRSLTLSDARTALFFLFLIQSAFFSVGNIAAVSAFSLDSVYRLIPVFDPFSQSALLLFKLLVPFAVMSANLGILNRRLGVAPSSLFMVVIAISDVLTLNFFWLVRDEGSWLDIGTGISNFVIASLLCAFVAGLEVVGEVFVGGVKVEGLGREKMQRKIQANGQVKGNGGIALNGTATAKGTRGNGNAVRATS